HAISNKPKFCSRTYVGCAGARLAGPFDQNVGAPERCVEALDELPMSPMIGADGMRANANFGKKREREVFLLSPYFNDAVG
uniref:hypothetical protein n=1 Tax=Hydrogenimonas sp. TaxID=2231112 RepID=UPI002601C29A